MRALNKTALIMQRCSLFSTNSLLAGLSKFAPEYPSSTKNKEFLKSFSFAYLLI